MAESRCLAEPVSNTPVSHRTRPNTLSNGAAHSGIMVSCQNWNQRHTKAVASSCVKAVTMALYLSLSLLAVLLAIPTAESGQDDPISLVF